MCTHNSFPKRHNGLNETMTLQSRKKEQDRIDAAEEHPRNKGEIIEEAKASF